MRPTCPRSALGPLLALLLAGCGADTKDPDDTAADTAAPDTGDTDAPAVDCPDGHADFAPLEVAPPGFVLLLTVDTLNRDFLGLHHEWDTTPNLDAMFREGVVLENVLMARGLSAPSLATVLTGEYPRAHGIRDNTSSLPRVPMIQERFQEAGWQTIAASGNMCFLASKGIDQYFCNWGGLEEGEGDEGTGDLASDEELVDAFLGQLDARDPDKPTFAWLHLMSPHDPYLAEPAYYEEFHPEDYDGEFEDATEGPLTAMQLGALPWSEADMRHLHAVYASELRGTDALIGRVLDGIAARGLADDGVLVFGSDHGDELGTRPDTNYIWHGCSVYNPVVAATWAIRAPGRLAAGETIRGWVSAVDLAPTVLALAQVPPGAVEGSSLVPDVLACRDPGRPVYFERGTETAGVIAESVKLVLDPRESFSACRPYTPDNPYPGKAELLYDLAADPAETVDLTVRKRALKDAMRETLCSWITGNVWQTPTSDPENILVQACTDDTGGDDTGTDTAAEFTDP